MIYTPPPRAKPRIFALTGEVYRGLWCCSSDAAFGVGRNPVEAYQAWAAERALRALN